MDDDKLLEQFLSKLIKEKGGSRNDYHLLKDKIAWIESKGDSTAIQKSSRDRRGSGRGKYQFEMNTSEDGIKGSNRAKAARTRTLRAFKQYGMKSPQWLKDLRLKDTFDASTLTEKQQDLLFFGDLKGNPTANLSKYSSGETSVKDLWLDSWWVGNKGSKDFKNQRQMKSDMWDTHQESFKPHDYTVPTPNSAMVQNSKPLNRVTTGMLSLNGENNMDYRNRALGSQPSRHQLTNQNAYGGSINSGGQQSGLNSFDTGGSHEASPHGGIPMGIGSNGKMNTVEQGETSHKFNGMKYIFSRRLKI
jgi:hypothetical protein